MIGAPPLGGMLVDTQSSLTLTENRLLTSSSSSKLLSNNEAVESGYSAPAKIRKISEDEIKHESLNSNFSALLHRVDHALTTHTDMVFRTSGDLAKKSGEIFEYKVAPSADISDAKFALICYAMSSLNPYNSPSVPANKIRLIRLLEDVEEHDPEFILKTAVYCRKVLNIRYTTSFIIAFAADSSACRPYLSKYYSAAVGLPSDWLKIIEIYRSFDPSRNFSLPNALRRAMVEKFQEFDQYQLAKYNREIAETKTNKNTREKNEVLRHTLSLKKMIRHLHISQPVLVVMSLLGKTYPTSVSDFIESGLPGEWNPYLAGTRMRLPVPYTWETELSRTPMHDQLDAWHNLIDSGKLPYMATLRNLRNLLLVGIDEAHMRKVIRKLTTEREVASSKQLPFRYLSAFTALNELRIAKEAQPHLPKKLAKYRERKEKIRRKRLSELDFNKVKAFEDAIERAFDLSIHLNLPTISGSTLIIVNLREDSLSDLRVGSDYVSSQLLLAFMCMAVCEDYDALFHLSPNVIYNSKYFASLMPGEGALLETVKRVSTILEEPPIDPAKLNPIGSELPVISPDKVFGQILTSRKKYTSMVVLGKLVPGYRKWRKVYNEHVGFVHGIAVYDEPLVGEDWMLLQDYSDSCIQILAHMGNQSLVKQVEMVDRQLDLSSKTYTNRHPTTLVSNTCQTSIELPANFLRGSGIAAVQVFVSSTFQDMYGERDLISGLIFPALRKQLSHLDYPVLLNEIDLRWGVPEVFSQSGESLRLCLEKVVTSDYLILLVGERYGWVPSEEVVQALPPKLLGQVLKIYKAGMSITEMEARLFIQQNWKKRKNLLCFLRDSACLEGVPSDLRSNFTQSSQRDRERLLEFKQFLRENGLILLNTYPASFAGRVGSVPMMGNLGILGEAIFKSLYTLISDWVRSHPTVSPSLEDGEIRQCGSSVPTAYLEAIAASVAPRHLREALHALLVDLPMRGAQVRLSRLAATSQHQTPHLTQVLPLTSINRRHQERVSRDGGVLCLIGSHGSGKTTLVSALAIVLSDSNWTPDMAFSPSLTTSFDSRAASKAQVSEAFRNRSRVFVHLTMGAYSSTTRHAGLLLCAIPQMTQVKELLDTWIVSVFNELRKPASGPNPALGQQLNALENELQSAGIVNVTQDSDLVKSTEIFHHLLRIIGEHVKNHYIFIVDSVDHLVPANLTWIPEVIPENVKFVLTLSGESKTARTLSVRPDCLYLRMSELSRNEKAAAIRCYFAQYGKALSDSGFGNQLSRLIRKRDAGLPLYLKMACDELRLHSTFQNLDSNLKSLPEHLSDLVAHIVARASVCCGENLVKTALGCILCSRHPPYPAQLQRMINVWLSTNSEQVTPQTIAFFNGDGDELPKEDPTTHPVLTTMALNVLLSQLQPLIIGVESTDESSRGLVVSGAEQVEETDSEERPELSLFTSGGLRLCSLEVADVVRRLCFSSCGPLNRFSASRRVGYVKSVVDSKAGSEPPPLSSTPTELQTYRLLLCENYDNLEDKVYYAFHAKKLGLAVSTLSSIGYIQQKALNNDIPGVIEEFLGSDISDPDTRTAWLEVIDKERGTIFSVIRHLVLRSGHILARFPHLTGQLLLNSLPVHCEGTLREEIERRVRLESSSAVSRCNTLSTDYLHDVEMIWRLEAVISPTGLASDGHQIIACGGTSGSITLLDVSSGKVLNTLYGHSGAVNAIVFISPATNALVTRCMLLYSVSADSTACLWKLVPSSVSGKGLVGVRLARISGHHNRAITACAWDSQRRHLVTAGLDGLVGLFAVQLSLNSDSDGETNSVSGYDLESFKKPQRFFSTRHEPINAMVLVEDKIVVGCWNGTLWMFETNKWEDRKTSKVLLLGSECNALRGQTRDGAYFEQWAGVRGLHAAVVALAYSGPKCDVIACADFVGEVTLINASTFECIVHLEKTSRLIPRHVFSRLCFLKQKGSDDCLLAHTGSFTSVSGAISLCNIDRPHKFDTLFEEHAKSLEICIGVSLTKSIIVFGTYNGGVAYFNADAEKGLIQLCPSPQNNASRIQALDCFLLNDVANFALLAYGSARGDVTFVIFSTRRATNGTLELNGLVGETQQPFSVWPHAYGHQEGGGGEAGGTLAIAISASQGFAVSGGGDASCCFHMFQLQDLSSMGCHSRTINSDSRVVAHSLGVSALASANNIAVSGGKDGLLAIYQVDKQKSFQPVTILDSVPQAHRDWITCLAIEQKDPQHYLIASGGNDHAVGVWLLDTELEAGINPLSQIWFTTEHVQPLTNFSLKDGLLISASADGVIVVWEATASSMRKLRKFTLSGASEGSKLVMMDLTDPEISILNDKPTPLSDDLDSAVDLDALSGDEDSDGISPTTASKRLYPVTVAEKVLDYRALTRLRIACLHSDGVLNVSIISPFLPREELACAGHASVADCSAIHLVPSAESGALVSACTSDSQAGEVCLWRLDNEESKSNVPRISHHGVITVIKESKGYIFAGSDDGHLLAWRVKDGRQLNIEKFVPSGCINDLDVSVSSQENGSLEVTVAVLVGRSVHFLTLSSSTESELVFDCSRLDLPTELYSIILIRPLSDPTESTFVVGTAKRTLICQRLGKMPKSPALLTDGIVSSLYEYTYSITSSGTAHYIGLCDGKMGLFDVEGKRLKAVQREDESTFTGLQVIRPKSCSTTYLLVSGTRENGRAKGSPVASFVSLRSDPFTPLSEYVLPRGEVVTAFAAVENNSETVQTSSYLVIVAGSDGILRYLRWIPSQPTKEPKLIGYLPTGRKVVKVCATEPDHFAVGYSNGDVGMYRFIKTSVL
ncbi:Telomerase protein component 1 [Echinococcus granulosus]|nr:Telomerase protein component 1 [Echinococcus granulosus]